MRNFRPLSALSPQRFHHAEQTKGIEVGKKPDLAYSRHTLSKSPFHCETPSRCIAERKPTERDSIARRKRRAGDTPVTVTQYGENLFWELGTAWPENYPT
jgi:hypothetical protein